MKAVASYFQHLLRNPRDEWHPILSVYYLTYDCDFRCHYCSDGTGTPYHRLRSPVLPADRVVKLLSHIRRHCEHLVITGGEPARHPELADILNRVTVLKFRSVILTTNGHSLETVLPAIAHGVTDLVISLQTLDSVRADGWYGHGKGTHQFILANLTRAASHPARKYKVILSSVVTPQNIPDLYEVYRYSQANGFRLAACPQLVGVKAHPQLHGNQAYRQFYDFLIREKRWGGNIEGTVDYLQHMRDLKPFACRPFTMLVVSPTGDVFYPCLELGYHAGNLFEEHDLHRLRRQGEKQFGPQPACDTRCHSACALGFSRVLANPLSALHEGYLTLRYGHRHQKPRPNGTGRVI